MLSTDIDNLLAKLKKLSTNTDDTNLFKSTNPLQAYGNRLSEKKSYKMLEALITL